jgi:Ca2+-binding RTX toxin-like protein
VALVLGAVVSGASAATVSVREIPESSGPPGRAATVTGTGADADDVAVTWVDGTLTVTDATVAMEPGAGCGAVDAHTATCAGVTDVEVDGGDGPDRLTVAPPTQLGIALSGGAGDDVLTGGPDGDTLVDGPGADVVVGGGGTDRVATAVTGAGLEADRFDLRGGDARFTVDAQVPGVTLDLAAGTLAYGGATVPVLGVRNATLGPRAGTLLGTDGPNTLKGAGTVDGRGGADNVSGQAGPDVLRGGVGDDLLQVGPGDRGDGGAGDDVLQAMPEQDGERPGLPAPLVCGPGDDRASPLLTRDVLIGPDCERTQVSPDIVYGAPRRAGSRATAVRVSFPAGRCGVVAWARSATGRALAPRLQVPVRSVARSAQLRFAMSSAAGSMRLAVYFPRTCPRGKRWTVGPALFARLALR